MKRIAVIIGSPRHGGNTEKLARAFIRGAERAGNAVDVIFVADYRIGGCIGCNVCYSAPRHLCALDDDMRELYGRLASADIIVIATPIYFYGVSAQLKALIDRLHNPVRGNFAVKKLALLAVCADTIDSVFDSVTAMYSSVLKYFSLEDGGSVKVRGVSAKGDIDGSPLLAEAENLGFGI